MSKRILLIRHGQTDWNTEGRWQGMMDVPLNSTGIAQARALAQHLTGRPVAAIYSSDLQRAALTAQTIGAALAVQPKFDARLRELNIGMLQGMTYMEMMERFPATVAQMRADYMDFVFPQGESRRMLQSRAYSFWEEVLAAETGPETVLVTHGGVIRVLLMRLFADEIGIQSHGFNNTSITVVEQEGEGWRLAQVGSTVHLSEDGHTMNEA